MSAIIGFSFFDFWCHIGHGSSVRLELVDFLVGSESKVSDLEIELIINEDVLEL